MQIADAKRLKCNDKVQYVSSPKGEIATGTVMTDGLSNAPIAKNEFGDQFVWVEVADAADDKRHMHPSNRLEKINQ